MRQILTIVCASLVAVVFATPAHAGEGEGRGHRGHRIFKHFDKNADGALTQDEVPAKLWERLAKADADNDGVVTKAELKAARERRRADRAETGETAGSSSRTAGKRGRRRGRHMRRRAALKHLDKNEDKALSQDEVPAKLWERISKADADGDNAVTRDEAKAFREARRAASEASGETVGAGKGRAGRRGGKGRRGRHARHRALKHLDKNGDKALSQDEVPAELWERLSKADGNGDGKVTKDEVKAFRQAKRAEKGAK